MKQPIASKVNQIRTAIGDNEVPAAFALAGELVSGHTEWADQLLLLQNNWTDLQRRMRLQLITAENATVARNQVVAAMLEILTEINAQSHRKEDIDGQTAVSAATELLSILTRNYQAFISQARIRNTLFQAMRVRLAIQTPYEFEPFFTAYFDQMDAGERDLHTAMREFTRRELFPNNFRSLEILMQQGALEASIPQLEALKWHLIVWLGKYHSVFLRRPSMALNYVGVEEDVPFPPRTEAKIQAWLARQ